MANTADMQKKTIAAKGTSISAREVRACFAQLSRSPKSSRAFLQKIGVTSRKREAVSK